MINFKKGDTITTEYLKPATFVYLNKCVLYPNSFIVRSNTDNKERMMSDCGHWKRVIRIINTPKD